MEVKKEISSSGLTMKSVDEAPDSYRAAPVSENVNPVQIGGPTLVMNPPPTPTIPPAPAPAAAPASTSAVVAPPASSRVASLDGKKKRGRPKKYGPDGVALSPMPISASIPLAGEFTGWQQSKGTLVEPVKKKHKFEVESTGAKVAYFVGANFTPHVLTVNPGEDVNMKIISFSQQGSRAVCVLSAIGTVSSVSLRQATSSGGTLTYEGRFEILSLSGSYTPIESGGTISRSGGMSVSLAGPDGRVVGGGLAGLLVAAGPVQVVVGSFLPGRQAEQNPKKHRVEAPPALTSATITNPIIREEASGSFGVTKPIISPISSFNGGSANPIQDSRTSVSEHKIYFTAEHSNGLS